MSLPPGPRGPLLWQSFRLLLTEQRFFNRCRRRYGDVFTIKELGIGDLVVIGDPELIKATFTGDPKTLHAGEGNRVLEPIVGPMSILLLDEQAHLRERKLLLPPFHGQRMRLYEDLMVEITDAEIDSWPLASDFKLHPAMQRITLKVILRAVFGIEDAERFRRLEQLLARTLDLGVTLTVVPPLRRDLGRFSPWGRFRRMRDQVDEILYDEIARRRRAPETAERSDVLSLLIGARTEDGQPMSDSELRDELMTMLVAGHETTATALAWTMERVLRHPRVLGQLQAAVAEDDQDYIDAVIKESLRVRPVLGFAMRRVKAPFRLGEWEIPAGAQLGASVHLIHTRPDIYPDPFAFRPERFLEKPVETYSWIPFGGGIRRCLGASFALYEMRTVLRRIIERCELRATDSRPEPRRRRAITQVPARGTAAVLEQRRSGSASSPEREYVAA